MYARDHENLEGNSRYVGFCADLIAEVARDLRFTYEIYICNNCTYGAPDDHGVWDGMVGELINKVDVILALMVIAFSA